MKAMRGAQEEVERRRMQYEEESVVVGPSLPDDGAWATGKLSDFGGALLPGEGEK